MTRAGVAPEDERLARLTLSRIGEPGDLRIAGLVAELGACRLLELLLADQDVSGVLGDGAGRLAVVDASRDLERAARLGIRWIVPGDTEWPAELSGLDAVEPLHQMGRAPLGLWVRGPLRLNELPRPVAVVGSRSATTYGLEVAAEIAAGLASAGHAVVSGAAYGIDESAHRGALAADGPTIAVLACGVDRAYPVRHQALLDHLAQHGAIVSEVAPGCAPMRMRFLARNRVIAALTHGSVIVEAAARSGALNTANWASRLNRPVMGVPGPVNSAPSEGVHQLIRSGAATLVTCAQDVLELVGGMGQHLAEPPRGRSTSRDRLTRNQQRVLDAVPRRRAVGSDSIARTAGLGIVAVRSALEGLAKRGLVEHYPTGWRLAETADEP